MQIRSRTFAPGAIIFEEGDIGDEAFVINRGKVEIFVRRQGTDVPIAVLDAGTCFGEMAALSPLPRSASARASGGCELMVINGKTLKDLLSQSNPVARVFVQSIITRLHESVRSQKAPQTQPQAPAEPVKTAGGSDTRDETASAHACAEFLILLVQSYQMTQEAWVQFHLHSTLERLALVTGLAPSKVQTVLERLAADELIQIAAVQGENYLYVAPQKLQQFRSDMPHGAFQENGLAKAS